MGPLEKLHRYKRGLPVTLEPSMRRNAEGRTALGEAIHQRAKRGRPPFKREQKGQQQVRELAVPVPLVGVGNLTVTSNATD
jgi:hypothetical protein